MSADLLAPYVKTEDGTYVDVAPLSARFAGGDSYIVLVWRKFRHSVMGMIGLTLVTLLLLVALFADFFLRAARSNQLYFKEWLFIAAANLRHY
jgi:hypothetical protein